MVYAALVLELKIAGSRSLKEKRGTIKPLINRLHREFNVSIAEVGKNDLWDESVLACALVCNERGAADSQLTSILRFIERYWRRVDIIEYSITFL